MHSAHYQSMVEIENPRLCRPITANSHKMAKWETEQKRKAFRTGYKSAITAFLDDIEQFGKENAIRMLKYRKIYEDSIDAIDNKVYNNTNDNAPSDEGEERWIEDIELAKNYTANVKFTCIGRYWGTLATHDNPPEDYCHIDYEILCIELYDGNGELVLVEDNPCVKGEWEE